MHFDPAGCMQVMHILKPLSGCMNIILAILAGCMN